MSLELQPVELTVEHMLRIHRYWITMQYVIQKKTEVEIVDLLAKQRLPVSLYQLHRLLLEWDLIPSSSSTTTPARATSNLQSREILSTTEPEFLDRYQQRPLPLLPKSTPRSTSRTKKHRGAPVEARRAKPEAIGDLDGTPPSVEIASGSVQGGSSPLEDYVMDAQSHEMIAIGLIKQRRQERACL